jgi:hypothetical protein
LTESRLTLARIFYGVRFTANVDEGTFRVIEKFYILMLVKITWVYIFAKMMMMIDR